MRASPETLRGFFGNGALRTDSNFNEVLMAVLPTDYIYSNSVHSGHPFVDFARDRFDYQGSLILLSLTFEF